MQNQKASFTQVTPDTLLGCLRVVTDIKRPIFIWGNPGIGKSAITNQLAQPDDIALIDIRASQLDAVDTRGVPFTYEVANDATVDEEFAAALPVVQDHLWG